MRTWLQSRFKKGGMDSSLGHGNMPCMDRVVFYMGAACSCSNPKSEEPRPGGESLMYSSISIAHGAPHNAEHRVEAGGLPIGVA